MPSKNLYRIGGVAAFLSALLIPINVFYLDPDGSVSEVGRLALRISIILFVLIAWSLYTLYNAVNRNLSLVAWILSIVGSVSFFINWFSILPELSEDIYNVFVFFFAILDFFIIPMLLFGILAYRHPEVGIPRILGVIGIAYSILWVIFYLNVEMTSNILNPLNLNLVWFVGMGFTLLFGKPREVVKS